MDVERENDLYQCSYDIQSDILHSVKHHQLVDNCVCLLIGAKKVVHSGYIFHWKQLPAVVEN